MKQRAYMPQAKTTEYETPPDLFDSLDKEFGPFTCDPACLGTEHSAMAVDRRGGLLCVPPDADMTAEHFMLNETHWRRDGLLQAWEGRVFLNPPYGREMPKWIEKAVSEIVADNCELVCALIPSRTDTKMWQKFIVCQVGQSMSYASNAHELIKVVRFLPGRLHFSGQKDPAPFPSAVVVWAK